MTIEITIPLFTIFGSLDLVTQFSLVIFTMGTLCLLLGIGMNRIFGGPLFTISDNGFMILGFGLIIISAGTVSINIFYQMGHYVAAAMPPIPQFVPPLSIKVT